MDLNNFLKRVNLVNIDFQLPRLEQREQLIDVIFEFFAGLDVLVHSCAGDFNVICTKQSIQERLIQ